MVLGKVRRNKSHPGCSMFPNKNHQNHDEAKGKQIRQVNFTGVLPRSSYSVGDGSTYLFPLPPPCLPLAFSFPRGFHLRRRSLTRVRPFISPIAVVVVVLIVLRAPNLVLL